MPTSIPIIKDVMRRPYSSCSCMDVTKPIVGMIVPNTPCIAFLRWSFMSLIFGFDESEASRDSGNDGQQVNRPRGEELSGSRHNCADDSKDSKDGSFHFFVFGYAQKTLGTSGLNSGRGTKISLPASSVIVILDDQKINCSPPSGIGMPTRSRKRTQKLPSLLCSPISQSAWVWEARDETTTPDSSSSCANPLAMPNCSATALDGNFKI